MRAQEGIERLVLAIDRSAGAPVLVIGSVPPAGRDLDLVVAPGCEGPVVETLRSFGFQAAGEKWVGFPDGLPYMVELIPPPSLGLPPAAVEQLVAQSVPIDGCRWLRQPAPHHRLLWLAHQADREGRLAAKRRQRVSRFDQKDWREAEAEAGSWGAAGALKRLRKAAAGRRPWLWSLLAPRRRLGRYRCGALISFSGLDGCGKSTQAELLREGLERLGYPTATVWTSVSAHPLLPRLAAPARLLVRERGGSPPPIHRPPAGSDPSPTTRLRERHPLLHRAWVTTVGALNGWWQLRSVALSLLRGRVVVCDRYVLDSIVHLRYRYGATSRSPACRLVELLSPQPTLAYLLDLPAEDAHRRKGEYTVDQLRLRAALYREEAARLGVKALDGTAPAEEIAAAVALEVWQRLGAVRDRRGGLAALLAALWRVAPRPTARPA